MYKYRLITMILIGKDYAILPTLIRPCSLPVSGMIIATLPNTVCFPGRCGTLTVRSLRVAAKVHGGRYSSCRRNLVYRPTCRRPNLANRISVTDLFTAGCLPAI